MANIKKNTYTDQIVKTIKQWILSGFYQPGSKVNEAHIADELSISRAPIREALQILIKEGLVVWVPQKGKYIRQFDSKAIRDSYFVGGILEAAAVSRSLEKYTSKDIERLEKIVSSFKEVFECRGDIKKLAKLDDEFHKILFSRVSNEFVIEFCHRSCQGLSKFLLHKYWVKLFCREKIYQRHLAILEAIKSGNADYVDKVIQEHYFEAGKKMSEICEADMD